jgi:GTP 3',8-cyclase
MAEVLDRMSRPLRDLRVSVTDRCNLRCSYCMPSEVFDRDFAFMPAYDLLSFEEIARLCAISVEHGVDRVRLTGGEPLLRRGLERLVEMLARIGGVTDIALTTNGTLLATRARALRDAGLNRVTVSLDALDEGVLHEMSGRRFPLSRVIAGIDAAADAGLGPVKINMVVRRGVNDHCILDMVEHFRGRREILRFIEYMDVGSTNGWQLAEVVPAAEIRHAIEDHFPLQALEPSRAGEVVTRWSYRDMEGEIGFIHSVSSPFCDGCTRARLSADGRLYTCLFATAGEDLRALLRAGAGDAEIARRIAEVWIGRSDRYSADRAQRSSPRSSGRGAPKIEMSYIGG